MTGSRTQAQDGQLSFLVGGKDTVLSAATSVMKAMSKEITHLCPAGSGAKMKLINNFLGAVQVASLAEALPWIEHSGLDRDKALSMLKTGAPGSPLLATVSARMASKTYTVSFTLMLMTKDLLYAKNEAARCNIDLKTTEAVRSLFETGIEQGLGDKDTASAIEPITNKQLIASVEIKL